MMGPTHAASGAAAGAATAIGLQSAGIVDVTAAEAVMFTGIAAGAALLPDLDHPSATIAKSFGPLSRGLAKLTATLSGGHRKGTHTLLGVAVMAALVAALVAFGGRWGGLAVMFVLLTFTLNSWLRPISRKIGTYGSFGLAAAITFATESYLPNSLSPIVLATAVVVGGVAHILGDAVTHSGVPSPLAPVLAFGKGPWGSFHVLPKGLRFSASGPMDKVLLFGFSALAAGLLFVALTDPATFGLVWAPSTIAAGV